MIVQNFQKKASDIIYLDNEKIHVSIASFWEIAIKSSIGKLVIKSSISRIAETCEKEQFEILSIKPLHLDNIRQLLLIHGDPFDRLLISQAMTENLVIITKDGMIPQYDIKTIW